MGARDGRLGGFLVIWSGQALSLAGTQAVQFALVWWLTVRTGSAAVLAAAGLAALAPRAVLGPFVGTLVDRWDRKTVMLVSDALLALASAGLAALFWLDIARPEHVLLLLLLRGLGATFHETAMLASTTLMVEPTHLTRIQGLNQALQGVLLVLSPALGALLYETLPLAWIPAVDIATALVAIGPLLFVAVPRPQRTEPAEGGALQSLWAETRAGLRYVAERRGHLGLLGIAASINLFLTPAFSLLPLLVHEQGGGAARMGAVSSSVGVGMLAGGLLLGAWGGFRRRIVTALAGMVGLGVAVLALVAVSATSAWFLGPLLVVGAMATLVNGPIQAILQATIAPEYQGRVFTLYGSLATIAVPLGLSLAAPVAETLGVEAWFLAGGVASLVFAGAGLVAPAIRGIEAAEATT